MDAIGATKTSPVSIERVKEFINSIDDRDRKGLVMSLGSITEELNKIRKKMDVCIITMNGNNGNGDGKVKREVK